MHVHDVSTVEMPALESKHHNTYTPTPTTPTTTTSSINGILHAHHHVELLVGKPRKKQWV
jgi:hypothetical protein